jgi:hypothetical protein
LYNPVAYSEIAPRRNPQLPLRVMTLFSATMCELPDITIPHRGYQTLALFSLLRWGSKRAIPFQYPEIQLRSTIAEASQVMLFLLRVRFRLRFP